MIGKPVLLGNSIIVVQKLLESKWKLTCLLGSKFPTTTETNTREMAELYLEKALQERGKWSSLCLVPEYGKNFLS